MEPYLLSNTNWKNVKDQHYELAILPWGATEAHNYHLPYGSDNIENEHIAKESARLAWEKGARFVVLPGIPFGVNTGQHDIKLDINLNPSTQMAILVDILTVLNRQGIYKFMILNGHGGNDFKQMLRELGLRFPKMFLCTCNWYQSVNKALYFDNDGDHADEMETSMLMYLVPKLVLPLSEAGNGKARKVKIASLNEKWAWAERRWSSVTKDTGIGDPSLSNPEKGEKYFNAVCGKVSTLIVELCQANIESLYED
ncbi:MAG: creatininase family protein [Bacteroidales bacterium]